MPFDGGSMTPSPRSRRANRPLPFITMPPPTSFSQLSLSDSCHSRPPSPGHWGKCVNQVQSVLYGGKGSRDDIAFTVDELYDVNATFENPLTLAKGSKAISEMFALLSLVPGSMHSESGEVAEASGYNSLHTAFLQHTLHIALFPFLDPEYQPSPEIDSESSPSHRPNALRRAVSFFSLPSTPYSQRSPQGGYVDPNAPPALYSKTHPSSSARWPISNFISSLMPRNLALSLTTVHLKLTTRLVFNEHGKIILHEDTWGLKEVIEGVFPIASHLYSINRQGVGLVAGLASRVLLGSGQPASWRRDEEAGWEQKRKYVEGVPGTDTPATDGQEENHGPSNQGLERLDRALVDFDSRRQASEPEPDAALYAHAPGSPQSTRKSSISGGYGGLAANRRSTALGIDVGDSNSSAQVGGTESAPLGRSVSSELSVDKGEESA
ncbi:hypothetical protein BCR35DRAFT_302861 [Leucosporidium creatinivorum]|uniref:Uncharacterized protein n=1 Tax=Leucosporidium creatinivorum TaxID=106004 RepID=A0A1Y2FN15_9BASI|nr:hypothetical protein BCR35DRAFT_302861 [Leucosporidium creatinivorum]